MDQSLERLRVIQNQSNPLCPYIKKSFRRLDGPQTTGTRWLQDAAKDSKRSFLDEDADVAALVIDEKPLAMKYSLKHKLRDHVHDLFHSLAKLDEHQPKQSMTNATYVFDDNMKHELSLVETDNRKCSNQDSKWAEQREHAKRLGFGNKQ